MRLRTRWCPVEWSHGSFELTNAADGAKVRQFFEGQTGNLAILVLDEARTDKDHAHYFACIKVAFDNLPEDIAGDFKSAEHLRKWALVKAGYCTTANAVCKSRAEAQRLAACTKLIDEYIVATIDKRVVTIYRPLSQAYDQMTKKDFKQSKNAVLDVLSKLIGTDVDELLRSVPRG